MIYTLGYQSLAPARLREITLALDAVLLDCRFKPVSRIPGFGSRQLEKLMQAAPGESDDQGRYVRMGKLLGGRGHTTRAGITALQPYADDEVHCVLLCKEEHPGDCHRHSAITGPHYPGALHIYRDRLFYSSELSSVQAGEIGFDELLSGSWDDWLAVLRSNPYPRRREAYPKAGPIFYFKSQAPAPKPTLPAASSARQGRPTRPG